MTTEQPPAKPAVDWQELDVLTWWRCGRRHHLIGEQGVVACSQAVGRGEFIRGTVNRLIADDREICTECAHVMKIALPYRRPMLVSGEPRQP